MAFLPQPGEKLEDVLYEQFVYPDSLSGDEDDRLRQ